MMVKIQAHMFCVMTSCSDLSEYELFREPYCLHLQGELIIPSTYPFAYIIFTGIFSDRISNIPTVDMFTFLAQIVHQQTES
jgi:hypothetical protein